MWISSGASPRRCSDDQRWGGWVVINLDEVGVPGEPVEDSWTSTDAIFYALAVGAGADTGDAELHFTTENSEGVAQQVIPTFGVVAAFGSFAGGPAFQRLGVDKSMTLHGE